jgi:3-phosphoshikimate 1-carboxyvinyltransferase
MSQFILKKASLKGEIATPPSKSHTLRAILFGTLGKGKTVIHDYLPSTDTQAMIEACRLFGATLEVTPKSIVIQGLNGKIDYAKDVINAGNSGIVLRFCSAIGALAKHPVVITGDDSIRHQRPMRPLLDALSQIGVSATSMRGDSYAPVIIQGPIKPGITKFCGKDSQHVSALLIASAFADGPTELYIENPGEKPWVALTLNWFDRLGIPYQNHEFEKYFLSGNVSYDGFEYHVPGDFSSAAFPIAAALITNSEITLKNIDMRDSQGDKELIHIFRQMGGNIEIDTHNKTLHVKNGTPLKGIKVDINDFVDAITILAVVACYAEGETQIYNASIAKQKECNRIQCVATELRKMGADITETEDGLLIRKSLLKGAQVHSYHDHRMAMSLSVAALGAKSETRVSFVECVSKTFPTFLQDFNALGAQLQHGK